MDVPQFRVETVGDVTVARAGGPAGDPLPADGGLRGLVARGVRKLVVDTAAVSTAPSSFLGRLIYLQQTARAAGCQLRVSCPDPHLRQVFEVTRLNYLIPVFPSLDEALAEF